MFLLPPQHERTPEWLVATLEAPGAIHQRLPAGGLCRGAIRSSWPEQPSKRAAAVSAADIAFMDTVLGWIALIPQRVRRVLVRRRPLRTGKTSISGRGNAWGQLGVQP